MLFSSQYSDQYTLSRDGKGAAQEVDWRRFVSAIDHPKLGAKPDQALQNYLDRMQAKKDAKEAAERKRREAAKVAQARKEAAAAPKISGPPVKEAELLKAHGKIREHFSTRFNDVRRGPSASFARPGPPLAPLTPHRAPIRFPRRSAAASASSTRTSRGR